MRWAPLSHKLLRQLHTCVSWTIATELDKKVGGNDENCLGVTHHFMLQMAFDILLHRCVPMHACVHGQVWEGVHCVDACCVASPLWLCAREPGFMHKIMADCVVLGGDCMIGLLSYSEMLVLANEGALSCGLGQT